MKKPLAAFLASLLLLSVALGIYTVLRGAVNGKSVTVAQIGQQITTKSAEAARLVSVRARLGALADEEREINSYFVPETRIVAFIDELQSRGAVLGASVEIASVAAQPKKGVVRPTLLIALSIQGSFDVVMRTLGSIEYAPYDLRVTSLTLAKDADTGSWLASVNLAVGAATPSESATSSLPPSPAPTTWLPAATSTPTATTTSQH